MFSQGKRNDILEQLQLLENPEHGKDQGKQTQGQQNQGNENGQDNADMLDPSLLGIKPERAQSVKVGHGVYTKYFKAEQSPKEVQAIVEEALAMYFSNRQG